VEINLLFTQIYVSRSIICSESPNRAIVPFINQISDGCNNSLSTEWLTLNLSASLSACILVTQPSSAIL
jgi:hypothetical protein